MQIVKRMRAFIVTEEANTVTEYAVMIALIIVLSLGAITAMGVKLDALYTFLGVELPEGTPD
jgi:Flp pilus assembly pilin Flp